MITELPDTPDLVARLNELLPPEIRVWTFVRALNSFNSRFVFQSLLETTSKLILYARRTYVQLLRLLNGCVIYTATTQRLR